jgi:hypothetical protein
MTSAGCLEQFASFYTPSALSHHALKLPKRGQSKHQPKTYLERHIIINRTPQIHALDIPLQPIHRYDVIAFPRRPLNLTLAPALPQTSTHTHTCHTTMPNPSTRVKLREKALSSRPPPSPRREPKLICLTAAGLSRPFCVSGVFASREWV